MIIPSQESLDLVKSISDNMIRNTFHHHYHILYDIAKLYPKDYQVQYVEIGAFAGGSACLMLQHPNIKVISIDLGTPIEPQIVAQNVILKIIFTNISKAILHYYLLKLN